MSQTTVEETVLSYREGASDKVYQMQLVEVSPGAFQVQVQYGRRGATLASLSKPPQPTTQEKAKKVYDTLFKEKYGKGYRPMDGVAASQMVLADKELTLHRPQLLNPVADQDVPALVNDANWWMQEKYDGHRRMMDADAAGKLGSINRKGERVAFPVAVEQALSVLKLPTPWRVDGELIGDTYVIFDVLEWGGASLEALPVRERVDYMDKIKALVVKAKTKASALHVAETYKDSKAKAAFLQEAKDRHLEGVVFKRVDAPYVPGRPASGGSQQKCKFVQMATCRVQELHDTKRSVQLELQTTSGVWRGVGSVTIPVNFTIPSKGALVEIRYLYAYPQGALAQPVYLGERDDVDVNACMESQLRFKQEFGDAAEEE